jgi:predicted HAD superfamily phosphohydrolase YqeG
VQVLVLSIEDRIKKLIGDIKLLKQRVVALSNGNAAPAPVLISIGISYFFWKTKPMEMWMLFNFSS